MAHVNRRRIMHVRPVGDNASGGEFPSPRALLILVEVPPANDDLGFTIAGGERMCRDAVDLTFGGVTTDDEAGCGDVMLHRPDVRPHIGKCAQECVDRTRRECAVAVFGVVVVETAQCVEVAAIYRTAVGVHELSQRMFIEHLLYVGRGDRHRATLAAGRLRAHRMQRVTQMASGSSANASATRRTSPTAVRAQSDVAPANPQLGVTPMRSRSTDRPKPTRSVIATTRPATSSTAGGRAGVLDATTPSTTTRPDSMNSATASSSAAGRVSMS